MLSQTAKQTILKNGFIILLCGLPFAHFLFNQMDIWHAQGHWFQSGLLFIFALSLCTIPNKVNISNIPVSALLFYGGISTAFLWYDIIIKTGNYPAKIFFPFFNLLCFVLFYKLSIEYLDKQAIESILKYLRYAVFILIVYGILQKLNLDQFYRSIDPAIEHEDTVVGTIGNPMHFANYLAICFPLFMRDSWFDYAAIVLMFAVLVMTGSTSGLVIVMLVMIYYVWNRNKTLFCVMSGIFLVALPVAISRSPHFFNPSGRVEFWKMLYPKFQEHAITGSGLGIMSVWGMKMDTSIWRHAHQAYYQVATELGIIGLIIVVWAIGSYFVRFKRSECPLYLRLRSIFFAFCIAGLIGFPDRLWLLSSMGMIGYCFPFVLDNEVINGKNKGRNKG